MRVEPYRAASDFRTWLPLWSWSSSDSSKGREFEAEEEGVGAATVVILTDDDLVAFFPAVLRTECKRELAMAGTADEGDEKKKRKMCTDQRRSVAVRSRLLPRIEQTWRVEKMVSPTENVEAEESDAVVMAPLHSDDRSEFRVGRGIDTDQYLDSARGSLSHAVDDGDDVDAALLDEDEAERAAFRPRRGRSNTLSGVSFDFSRNLLPLPLSKDLETDEGEEKSLGVINGKPNVKQSTFYWFR
jgi:hypothetical protein